jgi:hypothetical protein
MRLAVGNETDLRPPFFTKGGKLPPRQEIVENFKPSFNTDPELAEILLEVEESERKNIGPMSPFLPYEQDGPRKVQAVYSDKSVGVGFNASAWKRSGERLDAMFSGKVYDLTSIEDAISGEKAHPEEDEFDVGMDTSTNSGDPYYLSGWKPSAGTDPKRLPETVEAYKYYRDRVATFIEEQSEPHSRPMHYMCIMGQRLVQKAEDKANKRKRLIIAFPKDNAILDKLVSPQMMVDMRKWTLPGGVLSLCGWTNLTQIDVQMQKMLSYAESNGRTVLSGDVSNYDASLPPAVLQDTGYIAARHTSKPKLYMNDVDAMLYNSSLITPTKLWTSQPSSLKSGWGWTNLLGSLTNFRIQLYGEEVGIWKLDNLAVLGDDLVLDGNHVTPEALSEVFSHFNMESNPTKQFYKRKALHFLQRVHFLGIPGGIASVYRTLGSFLSFEKFSYRAREWSWEAYDVRALSQLQNAVFNPAFLDLLQYARSGDRHDLGSDYSPKELARKAGKPGEEMLKEDRNAPWKRMEKATAFENWAVNRVLRGEILPPMGNERFRSVHGVDFRL